VTSEKEEALRKLSNLELLELAEEASGHDVDYETSRDGLIKVIKSSLSILEIKQRLGQEKSYPSPRSEAGRSAVHRTGFPTGSVFSIISGIFILLILLMPLYDFNSKSEVANYYINSTGIPDFYASGYDLALGYIMFQGAPTQLNTQFPAIWLLIIAGMAVILLGFAPIAGMGGDPNNSLLDLLVQHSGTLIAFLGFLLFILSFAIVNDLENSVPLVIGSYEYLGTVVFTTTEALIAMSGVTFFSGLMVNRRNST